MILSEVNIADNEKKGYLTKVAIDEALVLESLELDHVGEVLVQSEGFIAHLKDGNLKDVPTLDLLADGVDVLEQLLLFWVAGFGCCCALKDFEDGGLEEDFNAAVEDEVEYFHEGVESLLEASVEATGVLEDVDEPEALTHAHKHKLVMVRCLILRNEAELVALGVGWVGFLGHLF